MAIKLFSWKDYKETCTMYSKSDNIELMKDNETDKIIKELSNFYLQRYNYKKKKELSFTFLFFLINEKFCFGNDHGEQKQRHIELVTSDKRRS